MAVGLLLKLGITLEILVLVCSKNLTTTTVEDLDDYHPENKYLQVWAKTFQELLDIPKLCRDVPKVSAEEKAITQKCDKLFQIYGVNKSTLCKNILVFNVVRNMCKPYLENEELWRAGIKQLIAEKGLASFAVMNLSDIYDEVKNRMNIKVIGEYIRKDVVSLTMEVLDLYAKKAEAQAQLQQSRTEL